MKPESLAVKVMNFSIADLTALPVIKTKEVLSGLKLTPREELVARRILHEISERLEFLTAVGLGYLSLDRSALVALQRRKPAHPAGHADWLQVARRALRAG